jgi:two-component system, cell cycle response regulator DivK
MTQATAMKRILYVEDDSINAFVMQKLLRNNFHVIHVPDGESCLSILSHQKFDLILMDINLGRGKMDGVETLQKIRKGDHAGLPILAITSYALPEDEDRFIHEGFDAYMAKPVNRLVLIEKINHYLA